jgi:hypothetical protein
MIILFYSNECKFCLKLLDYINKNNLKDFFKMINIDELKEIPENITIVPTIINSVLQVTLEGKKAFEFVINQKFFNHPTNNIDYWIANPIPKPTIEEDKRALEKNNLLFSSIDIDKNLNSYNEIQISKPILQTSPQLVIKDKKTAVLLKLKR